MTVGLVFQDPDDQLFAPTVWEDVAFGPRNMGLSKREVAERVNSALNMLPWVVCIDENGRYVIPVLNGHRGANEFARLIADGISAELVITPTFRTLKLYG